jgi:CheY-like chemotaxis protein
MLQAHKNYVIICLFAYLLTLLMPTSARLVRPLNILLVEPNADVQEAFASLLSCVGYTVDVAPGGSEALAAAGRNPPDVVLSELLLKDMSGIDLCRELRSRPEMKKCVVIAVTTYCNDEHKAAMLTAGFDHVLLKPVSLMEIMEVLRPIDLDPSAKPMHEPGLTML